MTDKMNAAIKVKDLVIGSGMPKICVSIIGETEEEIYKQLRMIKKENADIIEWRMDYCKTINLFLKAEIIIKQIIEILDTIPIIVTFRTKREGGEQNITKEEYVELQKRIIETSPFDFIDLELYTGETEVEKLIDYAHSFGKQVIVSNHEFKITPTKEEIIKRLCKMQDLGADIVKIAVMPNSSQDVLTLLTATEEMKRNYIKIPVITMAMGNLGKISRVAGELFGSSVTFGSMGRESAPGQIEIVKLRELLETLHNS